MMVYEYINGITQYGDTQNTLLLSDDQDVFPQQRIDKFFKGIPSDDDLQVAAQADYDSTLYWFQNQVIDNGQ